MTKQQVIDILEAYKPSGNIYNGYNSIEEKIDERICYLIDEIIGSVKQEPDNDWIKCSEKLPKCHEEVLVCNDYGDISTAMLLESETEWFSKNKYYNLAVGSRIVEMSGDYLHQIQRLHGRHTSYV